MGQFLRSIHLKGPLRFFRALVIIIISVSAECVAQPSVQAVSQIPTSEAPNLNLPVLFSFSKPLSPMADGVLASGLRLLGRRLVGEDKV